jgi:hypothetical protein
MAFGLSFALVRLPWRSRLRADRPLTGRMALMAHDRLGGISPGNSSICSACSGWLKHRAHEDPPDIGGVWGDVIAIINRSTGASSSTSAADTAIVREFRRPVSRASDAVVLLYRRTGNPLGANRMAAEHTRPARKSTSAARAATWCADPNTLVATCKNARAGGRNRRPVRRKETPGFTMMRQTRGPQYLNARA